MSIEIKKLSKSYFNTTALKNINLNLIKNEVIGLLGPNGAGKTTLLKILTGALGEWSGHVKIGNLDLRKKIFRENKISNQQPPLRLRSTLQTFANTAYPKR